MSFRVLFGLYILVMNNPVKSELDNGSLLSKIIKVDNSKIIDLLRLALNMVGSGFGGL